jgi:pyridoxamine 5'-phosphate oxidase
MKNLHHERKTYDKASLSLLNTEANPFSQFDAWYKEAHDIGGFEANAMVLSTVSTVGFPSSRMVLLKEYSNAGFVFFSNYNSRKGMELASNKQVSILFFYEQLQRQIRIEGQVEKLSNQENDDYFYSRPLESQYGAMVSPQSRVIDNKEALEDAVKELIKSNKKPQRPASWGGYIVKAINFEFWQGRPNRLHDRICYELNNKIWHKIQIAP